uniref:General transcription factor IIH subunit 4 n=1 Tax=Simocephalus serrulatus TaxID=117539 RepID=A0A4Y7NLV3_9CRUS|nr:EOG090X04KD [Simocephalus serrulatus]SVE94182.1 EOG090X04KD [Simocephalus serrulatus]
MAVQQRTLDCKDLHSYLKTLPAGTLDRLYNHPATCLAVFRELPELSRHYIMRILFVDQAVPKAIMGSWVSSNHTKELDDVVKLLTELRVWQAVEMQGGLKGWLLNPTFRRNLKGALLGGGNEWSMKLPTDTDPKARDISFLDAYAMERWECVLHFMVGSHQHEVISSDALQLLHHAGLMKKETGENQMTITKDGFQFLLMDTSAQVWYFLLQYLDTATARNLDLVECLGFLFQLSFSTLGQDYSTDTMSESLLRFLQHLREFGLVYQRKRKAGRFYPTRLALDIASGPKKSMLNSMTTTSNSNSGYIVVETNYRVYAYTDSSLQVALIALFCELIYRFPNLVVGIITRESIRQALRSGITAEQIVSFLRQHAHSECYKEPPVLPSTIADQIKLWALERDRFIYKDGVLYNQFDSQADFEILKNYAQDRGVLVWHNTNGRKMVVTKNGHDDVKKFWKRHSKSGSM